MTTALHMRQTLRDSSSERKKSPSGLRIPSFGLSSSSKKAKKQGSGSRFSSRFGDSSDEDEHAGGGGFRSRFEDSSDDEAALSVAQPKTLPPLLGQLQNQESLASTALPEELEGSDELLDNNTNASKPQQLPHGNVEPSSSPTAPAPKDPGGASLLSVRPTLAGLPGSQTAPVIGSGAAVKVAERRNSTTSKRSNLMTALRRKKRDSSSKISRPEITESAARRDTKLERNLSQLRGIRSTEGEPDADVDVEAEAESGALGQGTAAQGKEIAPPRSPKLQKRVVSLSRAIENGNATPGPGTDLPSPLALPAATTPIPIIASEEKEPIRSPLRRPSARSGNLGTRTLSGSAVASGTTEVQSTFLQRRTLSSGIVSVDSPSIAETAGTTGTETTKKKKFGTLRRMFGLDG
jgi:serine/arginine repetitive matrix protein 2